MQSSEPAAAAGLESRQDGTESPGNSELDALLLRETTLTHEQLERAHKVVSRLRVPKPLLSVLVELGQLTRQERERIARLYKARLEIPQILHEDGALDEEGMKLYREAKAASQGTSDRRILVDSKLVTEEQYLHALSAKHDIPFLEPEAALVETGLLEKVSVPYLRHHRVLPYRVLDDVLTVAMVDPLDKRLVHELEGMYKLPIRPCCATSEAILRALDQLTNQSHGRLAGKETASVKYREIREVENGEEVGEEAVRIVDHILYRAVEMGASDIHIEPRESKIEVRVRVDGVLQHLTELPADLAPRVAARIKVLCGADLAERRKHQDGRIFVRVDGKGVDLRVSTYASVYGETVVIRLLDRQRGFIPLEGLGFEPNILQVLRDVVLRASSGLVLVTGPTGSGKTTTLYSFVDSLLDGSLKVITCEDPVEYVLDGTTQCSVNMKTGPTFADSLRAMMRQDPDIIVVGEIRDQLTAQLGVEAALTGHKVFSSFHTEDAVSAVVRLLEMGVEPFLVSSTLSCIISQRLVRKICPECTQPARLSRKDLRYLGITRQDLRGIAVGRGTGCGHCNGTGYKGRVSVSEVLIPTDDFRDAILRRAPSKELRAMAKETPAFLSLQEDGMLKVAAGVTSLTELADNVPRDKNARPLAELRDITSRRKFV